VMMAAAAVALAAAACGAGLPAIIAKPPPVAARPR
jgi:hypothetical protein